ncbi:MAG: PspA/IM30 family protein [Lachnospiraceae bacterium]|nr:PspA/IM30 family protein [Lachnospiraceae bacterium]
MGILSRFKDIIASNINALLDKAEDPEKMIQQYLRNLAADLAEVKQETASVMADEEKAKRRVEANQKEIDKYLRLAKKALEAGSEEDAKTFIKKKQELEEQSVGLKQIYEVAHSNSVKMQQMHDKLVGDISVLNARKEELDAKLKIAKAQEHVNKLVESTASARAQNTMDAFARMEEKANKKLDEANAMATLTLRKDVDEVAAAEARYKDVLVNSAIDDELAALKAELGL